MRRRRTEDGELSRLARLVREHDRDRFLTALFAPADRRESLLALYAFNYEVAKTREMVSEPMLGRMRLQWWRDSIAAIYDGTPVRRHEVVEPLAQAIRANRLTRVHFDRLINAREADLDDAPPADLAALEAYAEASSVPLVLLALEVLGVRDEMAASAGRAIGIAFALAGLLRAAPFHARAHRAYLPADLVAARGIELHRTLFELRPTPGLADVAAAVAARARAHLDAARTLRPQVPRAALPALLPAVLAGRSLSALERAGYDVLAPRLARPDGGKAWRLAFAATFGRY
ncbi:MAG TPA: squalene/phytoene synthase family protein [Stellaceae bacterium]|nr:squalene/phytoene synthase family protein [Stellaceae bacterium]